MYLGLYLQPASGALTVWEGLQIWKVRFSPPLAFVPGADVTVLEACPRTVPVLPFKGTFANMGSLASWPRLRVRSAKQVLLGWESD